MTLAGTALQGATAAIVDRVGVLMEGELADEAATVARHCVLDWFGVALAAHREPLATLLLAQAEQEGARPVATIVGHGVRTSARQAALVNGAMGHTLDYDDLSFPATCHVTAAVLPAVLAIAESTNATGEALMRALVCGHEAAVMVGLLLGKAHYRLGFHNTGTAGCFGAAVASAALAGLRGRQLAVAVGIAGSEASGLKAQFGTMCKPLHAGKAAENGLFAAALAQRGFTAREDILECTQGFAATHGAEPDEHGWFARRSVPRIRDTIFKFSAACFGTHPVIIALGLLVQQHRLAASDIRRVQVRVDRMLGGMCNIPAPATGLQAKFSLRMNAALVLAGEDTSTPSLYSDAMVRRKDLVALLDKVEVCLMPDGWGELVGEVEVDTASGQKLSARHDASQPEADLAVQGSRLRHKFRRLAGEAVGEDRARRLEQTIDGLQGLPDAGELMRSACACA
jgi:2-methylcitrate dehydratase PrpD